MIFFVYRQKLAISKDLAKQNDKICNIIKKMIFKFTIARKFMIFQNSNLDNF